MLALDHFCSYVKWTLLYFDKSVCLSVCLSYCLLFCLQTYFRNHMSKRNGIFTHFTNDCGLLLLCSTAVHCILPVLWTISMCRECMYSVRSDWLTKGQPLSGSGMWWLRLLLVMQRRLWCRSRSPTTLRVSLNTFCMKCHVLSINTAFSLVLAAASNCRQISNWSSAVNCCRGIGECYIGCCQFCVFFSPSWDSSRPHSSGDFSVLLVAFLGWFWFSRYLPVEPSSISLLIYCTWLIMVNSEDTVSEHWLLKLGYF